jgi:hypothetical protein
MSELDIQLFTIKMRAPMQNLLTFIPVCSAKGVRHPVNVIDGAGGRTHVRSPRGSWEFVRLN